MDELYSIMRDLLEVEYNQTSLLHILDVLEKSFDKTQQKETALTANATKYYLKSMQTELKAAIGRMDSYLARNAKNPRQG